MMLAEPPGLTVALCEERLKVKPGVLAAATGIASVNQRAALRPAHGRAADRTSRCPAPLTDGKAAKAHRTERLRSESDFHLPFRAIILRQALHARTH